MGVLKQLIGALKQSGRIYSGFPDEGKNQVNKIIIVIVSILVVVFFVILLALIFL